MAYFGGIVSGTVDFFLSWGQDLFDYLIYTFFIMKDVCFLNTISDGLKDLNKDMPNRIGICWTDPFIPISSSKL